MAEFKFDGKVLRSKSGGRVAETDGKYVSAILMAGGSANSMARLSATTMAAVLRNLMER